MLSEAKHLFSFNRDIDFERMLKIVLDKKYLEIKTHSLYFYLHVYKTFIIIHYYFLYHFHYPFHFFIYLFIYSFFVHVPAYICCFIAEI